MKKMTILAKLKIALVMASLGIGAANAASISNADIGAMIKAKMPESVIIQTIQKDFASLDTSPAALIALKNEGASDAVLNAMVKGASVQTNNVPAPSSVPAAEGMSPGAYQGGLPPMYIIASGAKTQMRRAGQAGIKTGLWSMALLGTTKLRAELAGAQAQLRLTDREPRFEFTLPGDANPMDQVTLIRLTGKNGRREADAGKQGWTGIRMGASDKVRVAMELTPVNAPASIPGMATYAGALGEPLPPGEYAIASQGMYYDFGID